MAAKPPPPTRRGGLPSSSAIPLRRPGPCLRHPGAATTSHRRLLPWRPRSLLRSSSQPCHHPRLLLLLLQSSGGKGSRACTLHKDYTAPAPPASARCERKGLPAAAHGSTLARRGRKGRQQQQRALHHDNTCSSPSVPILLPYVPQLFAKMPARIERILFCRFVYQLYIIF